MSEWLPDPSASTLIPPNRNHPFFDFAVERPFEADAQTWSATNAAWMADLALLAYDDPPHVAAALERVGYALSGRQPLLAAKGRGAAQAYVAHNDHNVLVVFRGSEIPYASSTRGFAVKLLDALQDTLANLRVAMTPWDQLGNAHTGFASALDEVWARMEAGWLAPLAGQTGGRRVWFTGHSLGAAIAALAALRFGRPAGLYTFGAPRIGDAALAHSAASLPAWRVVLRRDLITRVPPSAHAGTPWLPDGYHHLGALRHVDAQGVVRDVAPEPEEPPRRVLEMAAGMSSPIDALSRGFGTFANLGAFVDSVLAGDVSREAREFIGSVHDHAPLWYALTMRHLAGWSGSGRG